MPSGRAHRRAYSIKTRIKTYMKMRYDPMMTYRRAYSIKTRIKTAYKLCDVMTIIIAEHIPLKQGLRLPGLFHITMWVLIAEHIPLKQGLRQEPHMVMRILCRNRRAYSIKTRIKTKQHNNWGAHSAIAEHIPLKQGLRLLELCFKLIEPLSQSIFH